MQPLKGRKKFRLDPKYPHHRSEGMSKRTNRGMALQVERRRKKGKQK